MHNDERGVENCQRHESANFPLDPAGSTTLIILCWATTGPFGLWLETEDGASQVRADGTLYGTGSGYGWGDSDMDRTWTWSFTQLREP